jgi:hypothetical protein
MRPGVLCVVACTLAGCSFEHGLLVHGASDDAGPNNGTPDAPGVIDAQMHPTIDAPVAPIDAPPAPPINLVAASAGATLVSFTSEYCTQVNPPQLCQAGYWNHTNINDDQYAIGDNQTAYRASWASTLKNNNNPETFEFSFSGGRNALVDHFVVQNWGRGSATTLFYSTHAKIYGRTPQTTTWTLLIDTTLATNETAQAFPVTVPVTVDRVRLSITAGQRNDYWELGEFEAWGSLQ